MINNLEIGKVFIVGAGPGDPGLITVKGLACIKNADVVLYDYLASPELLKHVNGNTELIYVGKKGGNNNISQNMINSIIIDKAKSGKVVTRLKGGDPFVFGRGGEEIEALVESGIKFEVVPGVTSAIAASAYAGIPLTHRQYTSDVTFITGHETLGKESSSINWQSLGMSTGTLVFFMGIKNLFDIVNKLKKNGRSNKTPVAIVRWGTTTKQITIIGNLNTIVDKAEKSNLRAPAIIVIGQVVNLKKTMDWFENKPLMGKSIIVTRARAQASSLIERLSELGANCIECPTIEVIDPNGWNLVDIAINQIDQDQYDWLILTSVNSVDYFFKRLFEKNKDIRIFKNIKVAVIGPATAKRLFKFGIKSDIVPEKYCAESIVKAFSNQNLTGSRICLPRASKARMILPIELSKMGAIVDEIPVYRTIKCNVNLDTLIDKLEKNKIDMITFTSSSTVLNFKDMFPKQSTSLLKNLAIASIGPITAKTAVEVGFKVDVVAENYTIDGLCKAILKYYS